MELGGDGVPMLIVLPGTKETPLLLAEIAVVCAPTKTLDMVPIFATKLGAVTATTEGLPPTLPLLPRCAKALPERMVMARMAETIDSFFTISTPWFPGTHEVK